MHCAINAANNKYRCYRQWIKKGRAKIYPPIRSQRDGACEQQMAFAFKTQLRLSFDIIIIEIWKKKYYFFCKNFHFRWFSKCFEIILIESEKWSNIILSADLRSYQLEFCLSKFFRIFSPVIASISRHKISRIFNRAFPL